MSFLGEKMKTRRGKGGKCKNKKKERGNKNTKRREDKKLTGKIVQNREEIREIGHDRSKKIACCERGKKYIFRIRGNK